MYLLVLLALSTIHRSHQHLTYPINYCKMAATCIHDNRVVCASAVDGCSRRNFLDQCDMYEYNCDFGTRYQETFILLCGAPTSAIITAPSTSVLTTKTTPSLTRETKSHHDVSECNPTTKSTTKSKPTYLTTQISTTETPTTQTEFIYTICCERPKTWETTTEQTEVFEIIQSSIDESSYNEIDTSEDNSISKHHTESEGTCPICDSGTTTKITSTSQTIKKLLLIATNKPSTKNLTTITLSDVTKPIQTESTTLTTSVATKTLPRLETTKVKTSTTETKSSTYPESSTTIIKTFNPVTGSCHENQTTEPTQAETTKCCDRPQVWETTEQETSNDFTKIHIEVTTNKPSTIQDVINNIVDINDSSDWIVPSRSSSDESSETTDAVTEIDYATTNIENTMTTPKQIVTTRFTEPTKTKEPTKTPKIRKMTIKISTQIISRTPEEPTRRWWYPTPCPSNRCQRPITWETTIRRKIYHGHRYP